MWWAFAASAVIGYLIGSIQVGLLVGRAARGVDIREYGSGATGAANVIRTTGARAGIFVIFADVAKGLVPVYLGFGVGHVAGAGADARAWMAAAAGFAAVCGHVWPLYAGFRGGKAVASGFGAALAMNPAAAAAVVPLAVIVVGSVRILSVMSITMAPLIAIIFIVLAALGISPWAYAAWGAATATLIVWKHRSNIRRLLAGTEPRIGKGGERRADAATRLSDLGGRPGAA